MFAEFGVAPGLHGARFTLLSVPVGPFAKNPVPKHVGTLPVVSVRPLSNNDHGIAQAPGHQMASYSVHFSTTMTCWDRLGTSEGSPSPKSYAAIFRRFFSIPFF